MLHHRLRILARATALLGGCAAAVGTAWWLSGDLLRAVVEPVSERGVDELAAVSFAQALDATCAMVLLGCVCWLAVGAALTVASYAAAALSPGGSATAVLEALADHGFPRRLRRLVLVCLGIAIGAGATVPATADPHGLGDRPGVHGSAGGLTGLALPDRTTGAAPQATTAPAQRHADPDEPATSVLVRPGDSLWTIASDLLPPGSSDRAVTAAWHRLHQANARRIGPDPDLIHPGTRLGVPDRLTTEREERR